VNAAIDQAPRHNAEALRIKVAKVDDIDGHGAILSRPRTEKPAIITLPSER
jgi:hypothetical protein